MLAKLKNALPKSLTEGKARDLALLATGTGALLTGRKMTAIALVSESLRGLETRWRDAHPEFTGSLRQRWRMAAETYDAGHQNPTNRVLHIVGIPMIVSGTAGLLVGRPLSPLTGPLWWASLGSFTTGWTLNFVGHAFEKKGPAFANDPMSFIVGPVWDMQQVAGKLLGRKKATA